MSNFAVLLVKNVPATFEINVTTSTYSKGPKTSCVIGQCAHGIGKVNRKKMNVGGNVNIISSWIESRYNERLWIAPAKKALNGSDEVMVEFLGVMNVYGESRQPK